MTDDARAHPSEALIGGRFRVVGLLGSGGTASVFEAVDMADGERVAVKLLHPHLAEDAALRHAFVRETELLDPVRHPTLCAPREAAVEEGDHEPRAWTAWDLAPGTTLAEHIRESGPLPAATAVELVAALLEGLAEMHRAGLVHRDVSPSNVVVDIHRGRLRSVRLVDFGLAGATGTSTRGADVLRSRSVSAEAAGVVGNVAYASPEQLRGEGVEASGDIYQVGGVLFFALVGSPPFARATQADVIRAHLTALPPTASVQARHTPVRLDRAIIRAMLKAPEARFASAGHMRSAIIDAMPTRPAVTEQVPRTRVIEVPGEGFPRASDLPPSDGSRSPGSDPGLSRGWLGGGALLVGAIAAVLAVSSVVAAPAADVRPTSTPDVVASPTPSPLSPSPQDVSASAPAPVHPATVPQIEGLTAEEARSLIDAVGLAVGTIRETDSPAVSGIVLASTPAAGSDLLAGARVDLVVANGWNVVPPVIGAPVLDAERALSEAGFATAVVHEASTARTGSVLATKPASLPRASVGTVVTLVVAASAAPTQPSPTRTPTPFPTPTEVASQ